MLLGLRQVLTPEEVGEIRALCRDEDFVDGGVSAPGLAAQGIKRNEQLAQRAANRETIEARILDALYRNETFRTAALPKRIQAPRIARYGSGMHYDTHVDNPIMERRDPLRADLSITLFLTAPEDYRGGELCLDTGVGETAVKLPAGDAILYPTTMLHRVAEVTGGSRLVAVTWIQSLVADPAKRKILYDLATLTQWALQQAPRSAEYHLLGNTRANLIRMWAVD